MRVIGSSVGVLNLICVISYLISNAGSIKTSGGNVLLLLGSFLLALISILLLFSQSSKIRIKKSLFLLICFILYFVVKAYFDFESFAEFKEITFGTTGGMVLFLLLGFSTYLGFYQFLFFMPSSKKYFFLYFCILLLVVSYVFQLGNAVISMLSELRDDVLLIKELKGGYQRPANFLTIAYLVLSYSMILFFINTKKGGSILKPVLNLFLIVLYILIGIMQMFYVQTLGSNSGLVMGLILMFCTIPMIFLASMSKRKLEYLNQFKNQLSLKLLSFSWKPLMKKLFLSCIIIATIIIAVIVFSDFDISKTRFFGFGKNDGIASSSFGSRLDILKNNFMIHFQYNPFLGNLRVQDLTTGEGSYVHNFILSILTHLGIIGFLLFIVFFVSFIKNILRPKQSLYFHITNQSYLVSSLKIYNVGIMLILLLYGIVGTFFTWIPFWFAVGQFGSFIYQNKHFNE